MSDRMFVVVHTATGMFARRELDSVHPHDTVESAEEVADFRRQIADAGGRKNDTYEVFELVAVES